MPDPTPGRLLVDARLAEPPSANRWWRRHGAVIHKSKQALAYQQGTYIRLFAAGFRRPTEELVRVDVHWFRGQLKTPSGGIYYAGDLDKRVGILLDALQGIAYLRDAQVAELHTYRSDSQGEGYIMLQVYAI